MPENTIASNTEFIENLAMRINSLETSLIEHMDREEKQARELVSEIKSMLFRLDKLIGGEC